MGYARYGKKGKGLSDKGQRRYNRAKKIRTHKTIRLLDTSYLSQYYTATEQAEKFGKQVKTYGTSGRGLAELEKMQAAGLLIPETSIKPARRAAGLKARGFAGEMTTGYSKHRGMPQVLMDALTKEKTGEGKGVSGGRALTLGAVGVGLYWILA